MTVYIEYMDMTLEELEKVDVYGMEYMDIPKYRRAKASKLKAKYVNVETMEVDIVDEVIVLTPKQQLYLTQNLLGAFNEIEKSLDWTIDDTPIELTDKEYELRKRHDISQKKFKQSFINSNKYIDKRKPRKTMGKDNNGVMTMGTHWNVDKPEGGYIN